STKNSSLSAHRTYHSLLKTVCRPQGPHDLHRREPGNLYEISTSRNSHRPLAFFRQPCTTIFQPASRRSASASESSIFVIRLATFEPLVACTPIVSPFPTHTMSTMPNRSCRTLAN